jgi:hypothetical protein
MMDDLFEALAKNGFVSDNVTLEYVIAHTAQDAQYSSEARENLEILVKYIEYQKVTIRNLKLRFLMTDCST